MSKRPPAPSDEVFGFVPEVFFCVFEIRRRSVTWPPDAVDTRLQLLSTAIELMLLWRRREPEPWQPSAQISVGRELAGDMHTIQKQSAHTHTPTHKSISACECLCVCCQMEPGPLRSDTHRCSFVVCTDWTDGRLWNRFSTDFTAVMICCMDFLNCFLLHWWSSCYHSVHA